MTYFQPNKFFRLKKEYICNNKIRRTYEIKNKKVA